MLLVKEFPMKPLVLTFATAALASLTACTTLIPPAVNIGDSEAQLLAKRGQPTHRYQDGQDHVLEYMTGPWGQNTYMARIDSAGRVVSFEQVLKTEKFATIKAGTSTKDDVLRTIGAPSETAYFPRTQLEVWSYPYKEAGVWNSLMHVYFDHAGVVRQMMNGPDPKFDPDERFPFIGHHRR